MKKTSFRFFITLLLSLSFSLALTGCWDKREINELAFVQGVIIDKDANNIKLILHILKPSVLAQSKGGGRMGGGGGGESSKPYLIMSEEGPTLSKALSKFNNSLSRELFIQQNDIFFISEKLARSGLNEILDALTRQNEFRRTSYLMVLKGKPEDIMQAPAGLEQIPYKEVLGAIKRSMKTSTAYVTNINDFFKALTAGEGRQPIMGVISVTKKNGKPSGISVENAAIFNKDKFIGYTNALETSGLLFINGKIQNGTIELNRGPDQQKGKVTLEIIKSKTSVRPVLKDNKLSMQISVTAETTLDEQETSIDLSNPQRISELEQLQNAAIKHRIQLALNKIQKEYKSDVFGFGEKIHQHYPKIWNQIKGDWKDLFPHLPVEIKVKSWLARTGITSKPPKY
ncbi:Ger(x)C family spore germination protein [Caldanaerobius polysaccharolyticus]|uniref:Ger(x)C family spore germination protein n=1 Tax=Caldanaerobius polysaccharolyticus TaxID=44256 RepID=UPI00047AF8DE|nr:Ger(x)C family spore germination protein [Caldanaerobius polysaccharolyticus]